MARRSARSALYGASDAALVPGNSPPATPTSPARKPTLTAPAPISTAAKTLSASGAVSGDELTNAKNKFAEAQAALAQAQAARAAAVGAREANNVLISGVSLEQNPEVVAARAKLDAAQLALDRTTIKAPIIGVVSKKQVEVGQQATVGVPLMAIVPTTEAYAGTPTSSEAQLQKVRAGQPVTLTSDLYGKGVVFHGKVRGLSGGHRVGLLADPSSRTPPATGSRSCSACLCTSTLTPRSSRAIRCAWVSP